MIISHFLNKLVHTKKSEIFSRIKDGYKLHIKKYPLHIVLQTTVACTLKCNHCMLHLFGNKIHDGEYKILSLKESIDLIDAAKEAIIKANYIQFTTYEAFVNKNIFKLMDYVLGINHSIKFPIITNGMLLDSRKIEMLETYPVSKINFSLDGKNKATVEKFKTGVCFNKLIETIKNVANTSLAPILGVVFILHKYNIDEFLEFIDFANNLGVKQIYVNNLLSFSGEFRDWYLYDKIENDEIRKLFNAAKDKVNKNKQVIWLPNMYPINEGCTQCYDLFIDPNGNVSPCDFLSYETPFELFGDTKQIKPLFFGNVYKEKALDIYKKRSFTKFRLKHKMADSPPPEICSHCIDAYSLMCSNRTKYGLSND